MWRPGLFFCLQTLANTDIVHIAGQLSAPVEAQSTSTVTERYYQKVGAQRMDTKQDTQTRPGHDPSARGVPMRTMNVGKRSAIAICEGRKTALVAPGVQRKWLPKVEVGSQLRLNFNGRHPGWAIVAVTGVCFHEQIATIPACEARHDPSAIDAEDGWEQILNKALCGGRDPVGAEVMEQRAAKGWYVIDFAVSWRHPQWCARVGIAVGEPE